MNRLILLGNGFDLAHGLPTRYEDFIFKYCKEEILCCLKDHSNHKSSFGESFLDLKLFKKKFHISSAKSIYKKIKNEITNKASLLGLISNEIDWINFYSKKSDISKPINESYIEYSNSFVYNLIIGNNGRNWSDIEAYFYKQLIDCLDLNNKITKEKDEILNNVNTLNKEFVNVIAALGNYLTKYVEKKIWL